MIYIGRRILDREKGEIVFTFVSKLGGKEYYWAGLKWLSIGTIYEAGKNGKQTTMKKHPDRIGEVKLTDAEREDLESKDAATESFARLIRLSKSASKKAKAVAQESSALRRIVKGMNRTERRVFVDHLLDEIETLERQK